MSVYPPLTPQQLEALNQELLEAFRLRMTVHHFPVSVPMEPGDEDVILREVAEFRGHIAKLDLALFRIFGFVHRLRESNVPTTLPPTRRPPPSLDDLEGMMS